MKVPSARHGLYFLPFLPLQHQTATTTCQRSRRRARKHCVGAGDSDYGDPSAETAAEAAAAPLSFSARRRGGGGGGPPSLLAASVDVGGGGGPLPPSFALWWVETSLGGVSVSGQVGSEVDVVEGSAEPLFPQSSRGREREEEEEEAEEREENRNSPSTEQ